MTGQQWSGSLSPWRGAVESLRAELAPTPGRGRQSLLVALATAVALLLSLALEVPSFAAPAIAFNALQPTIVCTWRNLVTRLLLLTAAAILVIPVAGVLVQLPWLLLPSFFAGVTLVAYASPLTNRPLEALAVLYVMVTALFTGVFDPRTMPLAVGELACGFAIGLVTATVFAQLVSSDRPSTRLARALAAGFSRARAHLHEVATRYVAERFETLPGEAPLSSQFARDRQLLELVRQEGRPREDVAFLGMLVIVVERALTYIDAIDSLGREPVGRTYRRLIAPEVSVLVASLAAGLSTLERTSREIGPLATNTQKAAPWPDHSTVVATVQARQLALQRAGALAGVDIAEEANTNAFVHALFGVADVLHTSPADLHRRIDADAAAPSAGWAPGALLRPDRYASRYALHVGLGTTISYLVGIVAHTPDLITMLWNPLFIAQSSYGATVRRSGARFVGVVLGCLLAILTTIAVMPNVSAVPALAILVFSVTWPCAYIALGGPRFSHIGYQAAFSFAVVTVAVQPLVDAHAALWRVYGDVLGTTTLLLVFRFVAPDYAGRQLIARFADAVRGMLAYLPPPGASPLTLAQTLAVRHQIVAAVPEILRLADDARAEGVASGVDAPAAIDAGGRALRIAYRLGIVRRNRLATSWPPLSEPMRMALANVEAAVRSWLEIELGILEARHTMARPGSRDYRAECAAAAAAGARPRPDLSGPLNTLRQQLDAVRSTELAHWPADASGALLAEVEHLRRIGELLPSLDEHLVRMILPRAR